MKGKVRWFNNGIGWGRIRGENGKDYHAHFSNILTPGCGFRTLAPDEEVEFKIVPASGDKIAEAVEIKRSGLTMLLDPTAPTERFEKIPWAIEVEVEKDGYIFFPQLQEYHSRDYSDDSVSAYYLGHPGSFEKHNSFAVSMPWEEICRRSIYSDIAVYLTNEEGGILKDRAKPNFRPGNYMVTIQVIDNYAVVSSQKISLRTQDSRNVVDEQDKGVWLVCETIYGSGLEIPEYETGRRAEQELKKKIEALIPAEFEWSTADNRKFAKVIAKGILAIRKSR